ncbi:DUF1501 domain-containing protein [Planctomicrobium sp. SH668]|uniref:DUF1501 domain-containing protein n=1 Tax=Planctomicrobium sp. SH668 TaxID=3448126 RepID=UPI003F5C4049
MFFNQLTRRDALRRSSIGFGSLAMSALFTEQVRAEELIGTPGALTTLHHPVKAKHVIFCFMSGGVSHVDSFDPKPLLTEMHGKPMPVKVERTQFNNNGNIMGSPFQFRKCGESGIEISSMFPEVSKVADELTVIRSMTSPVSEHAQGNFFMHTGFPFMGHPSAGAWAAYGLGTGNQNLPAYVVLQSGSAVAPHGGVSLFSNGFLPAQHQGSILSADRPEAIRNIRSMDLVESQRRRLDLVQQLDTQFLSSAAQDAQVEAAIENAEVAFRMQSAVPELCDLSGETQATLEMYGVESTDREKSAYAKQCLLARRLIERGVRFIELSCLTRGIGAGNGPNPWDQHGDLELGHRKMAEQVDQPISALIQDLRARGLLDETLIIWAGEFGRTPFSQGGNGRDHNPYGFSVWMAGGGVKGGTIYGATDEFGYHVVENPATVYDLWATALHQLGVDHRKLTYRYGGRDVRLTDVHGNVLHPILS